MVRCPARVGLLVQVLALAVCAVSSDDTSGKTNVVKVRTPGDGYATGRKIYVGVGCEVAILDGDAGISGDMAKSLLYTTGILPPSPFAPAPSSCVPGNEVNGIVPGYQGHVPRSRDQFGESAVGGLKPDAWNGQRRMGAAVAGPANRSVLYLFFLVCLSMVHGLQNSKLN